MKVSNRIEGLAPAIPNRGRSCFWACYPHPVHDSRNGSARIVSCGQKDARGRSCGAKCWNQQVLTSFTGAPFGLKISQSATPRQNRSKAHPADDCLIMEICITRRSQWLSNLKELPLCLKSFHVDIFYEALAEEGCSDEERFRLIVSRFRDSASRS
jgi:hypothetical protein